MDKFLEYTCPFPRWFENLPLAIQQSVKDMLQAAFLDGFYRGLIVGVLGMLIVWFIVERKKA